VPTAVVDNGNGTYDVTVSPFKSGQIVLSIGIQEPDTRVPLAHIKGSPYRFFVGPSKREVDAKNCTVSGTGLERAEVSNKAVFTIHTKNFYGERLTMGDEYFQVLIINSSTQSEVIPKIADGADGTYSVSYTPKSVGPHEIKILYKDELVGGRAFDAQASLPELDPAVTDVYGQGIKGGEARRELKFTIEPKNKRGDIVTVGGANFHVSIFQVPTNLEVPAHVKDDGDGTYSVTYHPTTSGKYEISVNLVTEHASVAIKNSPFTATVVPSQIPSAENTIARGTGLRKAKVNKNASFTIHPRNFEGHSVEAPISNFEVYLINADGNRVDGILEQGEDEAITAVYNVHSPGKWSTHVLINNDGEINESPFETLISREVHKELSEIKKVKQTFADNETVEFTIVARDEEGATHGGEIFEVKVVEPSGKVVAADVFDQGDGNYTVKHAPIVSGDHTVEVRHDGEHLAGSPFTIHVEEATDAEHSLAVKYAFTVQARSKKNNDIWRGGENFQAAITGPHGQKVEGIVVNDLGEGKYLVEYSLQQPGEYWIKVTYNGQDIKGSPWKQVV